MLIDETKKDLGEIIKVVIDHKKSQEEIITKNPDTSDLITDTNDNATPIVPASSGWFGGVYGSISNTTGRIIDALNPYSYLKSAKTSVSTNGVEEAQAPVSKPTSQEESFVEVVHNVTDHPLALGEGTTKDVEATGENTNFETLN